jgi:hypothetical protein
MKATHHSLRRTRFILALFGFGSALLCQRSFVHAQGAGGKPFNLEDGPYLTYEKWVPNDRNNPARPFVGGAKVSHEGQAQFVTFDKDPRKGKFLLRFLGYAKEANGQYHVTDQGWLCPVFQLPDWKLAVVPLTQADGRVQVLEMWFYHRLRSDPQNPTLPYRVTQHWVPDSPEEDNSLIKPPIRGPIEAFEQLQDVADQVKGYLERGLYDEARGLLGKWRQFQESDLWQELKKWWPDGARALERAFADAERRLIELTQPRPRPSDAEYRAGRLLLDLSHKMGQALEALRLGANRERIEQNFAEWEQLKKELPPGVAARYEPCFQLFRQADPHIIRAAEAWAKRSALRNKASKETLVALSDEVRTESRIAKALLDEARRCRGSQEKTS